MAHTSRTFGKTMPLKPLMERGVEFFYSINATDVDIVLERSKRISNVALTASSIAAEKLQLEGDSSAKQLVFAAYLGIGDITGRAVADTSPDEAERLLTSDQTHQTLLFASKTLRSHVFDRMTKNYRKQSAGFALNESGLVIQDGFHIAAADVGKGCPFAMGNQNKAAYFNACTDAIVHTYTQAYRQNMPRNIVDQLIRRR